MDLIAPPPVPRPLVGVFDSGLGGLSVLSELLRTVSGVDWVYVADSAHAPYGERSEAYVLERSRELTRVLAREHGCGCIVIACNTATAVAANDLRAQWPELPIVGVEPGIKPAAALTRNGRIGVMATDATLRSDRFRRLVDRHASGLEVIGQACTGLAAAIEEGQLGSERIATLLDEYCGRLAERDVDTVVLGCTHYSFVSPHIRARLPATTQFVDTAHAVAQQAGRVWQAASQSTRGLENRSQCDGTEAPRTARIRLLSSADPARLVQIAARWLPQGTHTELQGMRL